MADTTPREALYQDLLGLARHSFVSYVVESSSPVVVDEADSKLLQAFKDILAADAPCIERAYDLAARAGIRPDPPSFSLKFSNFNFLRPAKTAERWPGEVAKEIAALEGLRDRVPADDPLVSEFRRVADDLIAHRRDSIRLVAEARPTTPA